MVEPLSFIALIGPLSTAARNLGLIKSSSDRVLMRGVHSLVEQDYQSAMKELELASATDSDEVRERAIVQSVHYLKRAVVQQELAPAHRGLAAGLLAAFALRDSDRGAARMWVRDALKHYDAVFTELVRRSEASEFEKTIRSASIALPSVHLTFAAVDAVMVGMGKRRWVTVEEQIAQLNAQGQAVAELAEYLDVPTDGALGVVDLGWRRGRRVLEMTSPP